MLPCTSVQFFLSSHKGKTSGWSKKVLKVCSRFKSTLVLGIETSCDDTCIALVDSSGLVVGDVRKSQIVENDTYGGVYPLVAGQSHKRSLPIAFSECMHQCSQLKHTTDFDYIAVTIGPGLAPCLGEGLEYAKKLSMERKKPILCVNHMEAHVMVNSLQQQLHQHVTFPSIGLLLSGGHSEIVYCPGVNDPISKIGYTTDDACGECIDKVIRCLDSLLESSSSSSSSSSNSSSISSPLQLNGEWISSDIQHQLVTRRGGSKLEYMASLYSCQQQCVENDSPLVFPQIMKGMKSKSYNMSFSGIKTHCIRMLNNEYQSHNNSLSFEYAIRFCYWFQKALIHHILDKLSLSLQLFPESSSIICGGGVMCNQALRSSLKEFAESKKYSISIPPPKYCTDNAVMIAWRGLQLLSSESSHVVSQNDIPHLRFDPKLEFDMFHK